MMTFIDGAITFGLAWKNADKSKLETAKNNSRADINEGMKYLVRHRMILNL